MASQSHNFKAQRGTPRAEWPNQFRELLSFLLAPSRWACARKITWSETLERLRVHLLFWIYRQAGAPTLSPDGTRNVLRVVPVYLRPTSRRVVMAAHSAQRNQATADALRVAKDFRGLADSQSFLPRIAEIAYVIAPDLGVRMPRRMKTALRDNTRTQWAMQTVIQRVINALAQEADGVDNAPNALDRDIQKALTSNQHPVADRALRGLRSPSVRARVVDRVRKLLGRSGSPFLTSAYLKWLEEQGYMVQLFPDCIVPVPLPGWSSRAEGFPSSVKDALIPVLRQADNALSTRWSICRLCARPSPQSRVKAATCPACRRRHESRYRKWLLSRAPEGPIVFHPLADGASQGVRLVIADGIRAPLSLRRAAQSGHAPKRSPRSAGRQGESTCYESGSLRPRKHR